MKPICFFVLLILTVYSASSQFYYKDNIATRDLMKKAFYEAWPLFEHEAFEEEWRAERLSVLRHNRRDWDVIHTAPFKGK